MIDIKFISKKEFKFISLTLIKASMKAEPAVSDDIIKVFDSIKTRKAIIYRDQDSLIILQKNSRYKISKDNTEFSSLFVDEITNLGSYNRVLSMSVLNTDLEPIFKDFNL